MPGHSSSITPLALDLLTNMDWANPSDNIIGALFPNFFIVYFGQDFPQGGISSDDIKVKFAKLGTGLEDKAMGQGAMRNAVEDYWPWPGRSPMVGPTPICHD